MRVECSKPNIYIYILESAEPTDKYTVQKWRENYWVAWWEIKGFCLYTFSTLLSTGKNDFYIKMSLLGKYWKNINAWAGWKHKKPLWLISD